MASAPDADPTGARLLYVGHGTVLVALDGTRVLTDPLLRTRVAHLRRAVPVAAAALRGIDAVLVSHLHYDHLDVPSLQRLGRDVPLVVPRGAGPFVRRRTGARHVLELEAGDELALGRLRVRATPALHDAARLPFGARAEPLGYVLEGSRTVYFAGDTDLFPGMAELAPLDVALVPIWGWGPSLGTGHLDPGRAAESLALLRPRIAVPIHWGTYHPVHHGVMTPPGWLRTPPGAFVEAAARVAPAVEVRVLEPGEETRF